ncbi:MAG: HD domain-containing protein [Clostridiales bacterium]|nr:HD domain-containing protein [Clostridiales bacterium]
MKIGIFGGAFDPVHKGHAEICKKVVAEYGLDKLIVVPSYNPPHKRITGGSFLQRKKLLTAALADIPAEISDIEYNDKKNNFTFEVVAKIAGANLGCEPYYIVGGDALSGMPSWKNPERIFETAAIIAIDRPGYPDVVGTAARLRAEYGARVSISRIDAPDISSNKIRTLLELGDTAAAAGLLPDGVIELIVKDGMYRRFRRYLRFVRAASGDGLFGHVKRAVIAASEYNERAGLSSGKVFLSALLHDAAKEISFEAVGEDGGNTVYRVAETWLRRVDGASMGRGYYEKLRNSEYYAPSGTSKPVLHQFLGAEIAKKVLAVSDKAVIDAVRYHTTAKPGMTSLGKIVYLADKTEAERDYEGVDGLRRAARLDIDGAFWNSLERNYRYVSEKTADMTGLTREAYEYYSGRRSVNGG